MSLNAKLGKPGAIAHISVPAIEVCGADHYEA